MDWLETVLTFAGVAHQLASPLPLHAVSRPYQAMLAGSDDGDGHDAARTAAAALLRCALPAVAAILGAPDAPAALDAASPAGNMRTRHGRACSAFAMLALALEDDMPYAPHIRQLSPPELAAAVRDVGRVLASLPRSPPPGMPPNLVAVSHTLATRLLYQLTDVAEQAAAAGGPAAAGVQDAAWAAVGAVPAMRAALEAMLVAQPRNAKLLGSMCQNCGCGLVVTQCLRGVTGPQQAAAWVAAADAALGLLPRRVSPAEACLPASLLCACLAPCLPSCLLASMHGCAQGLALAPLLEQAAGADRGLGAAAAGGGGSGAWRRPRGSSLLHEQPARAVAGRRS